MPHINLVFRDGHVERRDIHIADGRALVGKGSIPENVSHIDFMPDSFAAKAGETGFFLIPSVDEGSHHAALTRFLPRPDIENVFPNNSMPVYGVCHGAKATLAVVAGMSFEYSLVVGVKAGNYYLHPRFVIDGAQPYEDIDVRFFELSGADASFAGMARRYRQYQLDRGACRPLRERAAKNPVLKEMARGLEVRLRLAWKPVPSPVDDQTEETEPPVHVELTFKQVGEIIDEFHRQGIAHAEFCLVGWNVSGHDGRFPDIFPPEPGCGTEDDLKELVRKARTYGYLIVCHTNVLEGYSIAKRFKRENLLVNRDGSWNRGWNWAGGKSYRLCPQKAHEDYFVEDAKNLKAFGFEGAHYLDVLSITRPDACHHPEHPLTRREAAAWRSKTLALARETFGASASEGAWDFCVDDLDYVLYAAFFLVEPKPLELCDEFVPFWFIAYHGIQLYNCFAASVNACSKPDKTLSLRNYSWGGRPLSYFNSKFITGWNPWGDDDIRYTSPEQLRGTVAVIKADYERYQKICDLQYEFIEDIEEFPGDVRKTTFSNGAVLTCDLASGRMCRQGAVGETLEIGLA